MLSIPQELVGAALCCAFMHAATDPGSVQGVNSRVPQPLSMYVNIHKHLAGLSHQGRGGREGKVVELPDIAYLVTGNMVKHKDHGIKALSLDYH